MSDAGPEALVGLLAEESRLKVVAAVVVGARQEPDIVTATGLTPRTVGPPSTGWCEVGSW